MNISVIIVSYNTADLIAACLESVMASQKVDVEVFVVDNASKDASVEIVRKQFPEVKVIANDTNLGFGRANNQALRESSGQYVIFLNPDTTVEPESFFAMVTFMQDHPKVGLAGPRVQNPDGSRQDSVSFRYPGHRFGAADLGALPGEIACVLGACQIASAKLLKEIGGFDEDFFLYGEDQDLCLRIRKRGFEIGFIDSAVIMHHGGQSERATLPAEVVRKKMRGEWLFYHKHYRRETIEKLLRLWCRRAYWRIAMLRMQCLLPGMRERATQKLARYHVIYDEARAELLQKGSKR